MAHSRSFLANQKARNAIVGAENYATVLSKSTDDYFDILFSTYLQDYCIENPEHPMIILTFYQRIVPHLKFPKSAHNFVICF